MKDCFWKATKTSIQTLLPVMLESTTQTTWKIAQIIARFSGRRRLYDFDATFAHAGWY